MKDCVMCGGTGKTKKVWYGKPTGEIGKCTLCNGTGKSNAVDIFNM